MNRSWFRFRISFLLLFTAMVAILLTFVPIAYHWWLEVPMADEVTRFNLRAQDDPVGKYEPALTEPEVVAAIRAQQPLPDASSRIRNIYARIARSNNLPHDATITSGTSFQLRDHSVATVWWIDLRIKTGGSVGYVLRIREENDPVAKPTGEPTLVMPVWPSGN